jgi:hypothetical protein
VFACQRSVTSFADIGCEVKIRKIETTEKTHNCIIFIFSSSVDCFIGVKRYAKFEPKKVRVKVERKIIR